MSTNPVTLAVHELEALLEKAKAAAEHIIHPTEAAPVAAAVEPVAHVAPVAPVVHAAPVAPAAVAPAAVAPAKPVPAKAAPVAKPAGVRIAGQTYAKDGLTQEWRAR
jgi:hypothetical protein